MVDCLNMMMRNKNFQCKKCQNHTTKNIKNNPIFVFFMLTTCHVLLQMSYNPIKKVKV